MDSDSLVALVADEDNLVDRLGQGQDAVVLQQNVRVCRDVACQLVVRVRRHVAREGAGVLEVRLP